MLQGDVSINVPEKAHDNSPKKHKKNKCSPAVTAYTCVWFYSTTHTHTHTQFWVSWGWSRRVANDGEEKIVATKGKADTILWERQCPRVRATTTRWDWWMSCRFNRGGDLASGAGGGGHDWAGEGRRSLCVGDTITARFEPQMEAHGDTTWLPRSPLKSPRESASMN